METRSEFLNIFENISFIASMSSRFYDPKINSKCAIYWMLFFGKTFNLASCTQDASYITVDIVYWLALYLYDYVFCWILTRSMSLVSFCTTQNTSEN